jgi:hypothetical protein
VSWANALLSNREYIVMTHKRCDQIFWPLLYPGKLHNIYFFSKCSTYWWRFFFFLNLILKSLVGHLVCMNKGALLWCTDCSKCSLYGDASFVYLREKKKKVKTFQSIWSHLLLERVICRHHTIWCLKLVKFLNVS